MKKLISVVPLLLFISCKENKNPHLASAYFPLQVGNNWEFLSSSDSSIWRYEIADTKVFSEHDYFERVLTFSDGTKDTGYFRTEENKVLIYYEGDDYIYIDFDKSVKEEWNSYGDNYGYINKVNISTHVEAGNFDNVIEVYTGNKSVTDVFRFDSYAPGVGLVESIMFRIDLTLVNARVNGINYP